MTQHTPGPWKAHIGSVMGRGTVDVITGTVWVPLAHAFTTGTQYDEDGREYVLAGEREANAKLIAAAPDLLEYVRRCASNDAEANELLKKVEGNV